MNPLPAPSTLRKNGFTYTQVCRGERSCVYEQLVTPEVKYYEVFIIKTRAEEKQFGKVYPAREVFPSNEDFGATAWSCRTLEKAMRRFNEIERGAVP